MPSGQVNATVDRRRLHGSFDGNTLHIGSTSFLVQRTNNGLTTIQDGNYNNQVHYYRVR